jgi:hypothetical protein
MTKFDIAAVNSTILKQASQLRFQVADLAPSTFNEVASAGTLTVWSGGSDSTIFDDAKVNWAFRAIHDALHIATRLGFTVAEEVELARIHAAKQSSGLMADLIWIEVALQAKHLEATKSFISDQRSFTFEKLKQLGYQLAA